MYQSDNLISFSKSYFLQLALFNGKGFVIMATFGCSDYFTKVSRLSQQAAPTVPKKERKFSFHRIE
jgi:hypothetical protein